MVTKGENALILYQILSTNSSRKCKVISQENLYVDIAGRLEENKSESRGIYSKSQLQIMRCSRVSK